MSTSIPQISLEDFFDSSFMITDSLPISDKCLFGDNEWDFSDENNPRQNSITRSKLSIDWNEWDLKINKAITKDFKVLSFVYLKCPILVTKRKKPLKPNSIMPPLRSVLSIFEMIIDASTIQVADEKICLVQDLSDISLEQFESIPLSPSQQRELKKYLSAMAVPGISKFLSAKPTWKQADIKTLKLSAKPVSNIKDISTQPFSDEFFSDLVKQSTLDVIGFKKFFLMQIHSKVPESYLEEITDLFQVTDLKKAFEEYTNLRNIEREKSIQHGKRGSYSSNLYKDYFYNHGIKVTDFNKKLIRIQRAAILLLFAFTGIRYSDGVSFRKGCIVPFQKDIYVLKGSHIKNNDSSLPSDIDEWVAIPIVRDAVEILELFQEFSFNSYIVSSLFSVYLNVKNLPLSSKALIKSLNLYVKELSETNGKFLAYYNDATNHISLHRFRHTLALQLARAKLGVPYISFHLKHLHTGVVAYRGISNVTLGYGGIANELFNSIPAIKQARGEFYDEIYNPKSSVAGGLNSEEYKARRKEYFQGQMVNDLEIEDVIEDLKERSIPFVDVGLGYCGGRKDIVQKDGTKIPPPCIGHLKCNPIDCGNAFIPKSKLPIWEKIYKENFQRLNDPEYSYAKEELQDIVNQSRDVIEQLKNEV